LEEPLSASMVPPLVCLFEYLNMRSSRNSSIGSSSISGIRSISR
jgi:hypothetical protein